MLFNIAPSNAERVKKEFTATRPEHAHGYFKSVILTSENRFYTYRIDMICGYYILTVRTRNKEQLEIIATFEEYKPGSIAATKGELYKNGSGYPYRIEKSERYLKKYDQLACIVHGAIAAGLLFDMLEDEPTPAPLPEESMPESFQKSPQEENMRRFTIYTDSNMAGIDSRGAYTTLAEARMRLEKELDEDETSRGGYIFDELRQKVTAIYNGFNLEKIPEPYRGTPNEYTTRKQQDATRAMLESIMNKCSEPTPATSAEVLPESNQDTTTGAQEGPTTAGTTAANETPTTAETAPQDATSEATTAETATERPETSTATQDTTGSDTRPPRATEEATTGNAANTSTPATAAGDTSTPANQEPGTAAKSRNNATPCDNTRHHATPGHACENAPGRTERAQAEQVPTEHTKSPPRAQTRAGRNTSRSSPDRRKVTFSAWMYKTGSDPLKILWYPIFVKDFSKS